MFLPNRFHTTILFAAIFAAGSLRAQSQDAPPVDLAQLLQALRGIKEQQVQQAKVQKGKALQDVQAAAASPATAAAAWEEAVRQIQFEGMTKEGAQFREWKEKEGDALREKEASSAAQLHFKWMALTLQAAMGAPIKEMLPKVVAFTKEVAADQTAADALEETIKREKETAGPGRPGRDRDRKTNSEAVKRLHDRILSTAVNAGPPALAMKIGELLNVDKWEMAAGNVDGIFGKIVLPELRAQKDPRLLEYWDLRLKRDGERAARSKLAFDADQFNQVRRPEILWSRAQDILFLGQRNRAINEMFNLVKSFPQHPNAGQWMAGLEQVIMPPPAAPVAPPEGIAPAPANVPAAPAPSALPPAPPPPPPLTGRRAN